MEKNRTEPRTPFHVWSGSIFVIVLSFSAGWLGCGNAGGGTANLATPSGEPATDSNSQSPGQALNLDVNQFIALASDSTESSSVALGTRYATAARVVPSASQKAFLTSASQVAAVPSSGENSDLSYKAFPVTLYPSGSAKPSPIDVMQHAIGNCDGDAALAALAYEHPDFVKSLIHASSTTTWDIRMFSPDGEPLTVSVDNRFVASSDGSIAAVSGRNGVANWATVLEKALMKYNVVYGVSNSGGMAQIGGIGSEHTLPMFTRSGISYAFSRGRLSASELQQEVKNALDNGMLVTGGFGVEDSVDGFKTVTAHAYTLLWPRDDAVMVSMRNPWGLAQSATSGAYDASADGVINIPLDAKWAATIDLRIIDPGEAGHGATTTPYTPIASRRASDKDVEVIRRAIESRLK